MARTRNQTTPKVGTFVKSNSAPLVEAVGYTDLDFVVLDRQHGRIDIETVENMIRAGDLTGLSVVVRTRSTDLDSVNNYLDAGASGIMIPQVEDEADVQRFVDETDYAKARSFSTTTRAGKYGTVERKDYLDRTTPGVSLFPIIETKAALDAVEEIAVLDRVEALVVGRADLSIELGLPPEDPELRRRVSTVIEIASESGCGAGLVVQDPEDLTVFDVLPTHVLFGTDLGLVTSRITSLLSRVEHVW